MRLAELCGVAAPPHLPHSHHRRFFGGGRMGFNPPPAARYLHRLLRHGIFLRLLGFFCQGRFFQGPGGDKDVSRGAEKPHPATACPHHPKKSPPHGRSGLPPQPHLTWVLTFSGWLRCSWQRGPSAPCGGRISPHPSSPPPPGSCEPGFGVGERGRQRGKKKKGGTEPRGALRRAAQPPPHKAALTLVRSPNAERFLGPPWGEDGDRLAWQLSSCNTVG